LKPTWRVDTENQGSTETHQRPITGDKGSIDSHLRAISRDKGTTQTYPKENTGNHWSTQIYLGEIFISLDLWRTEEDAQSMLIPVEHWSASCYVWLFLSEDHGIVRESNSEIGESLGCYVSMLTVTLCYLNKYIPIEPSLYINRTCKDLEYVF